VKVSEEEFLVMIRWEDETIVRNAQVVTSSASVISYWIDTTAQFISFETGVAVYEDDK